MKSTSWIKWPYEDTGLNCLKCYVTKKITVFHRGKVIIPEPEVLPPPPPPLYTPATQGTFRLHTESLHQVMRSTGYAKPYLFYKALCCAVIGWFSTAVIGAF